MPRRARDSARKPDLAPSLAVGIVAASTVLFARVLVAATVLNASLVPPLALCVAAPLLLGILILLVGWRRMGHREERAEEPANPLHLRSALQMAVLFQAVLFLVHIAKTEWGGLGLLASGAIVGLTDLDALTISMAETAQDPAMVSVAAGAIGVGLVSNTIFKAAVAAFAGRGAVRTMAPLALLAMAVAIGAALYLTR